MKKLLLLLWFPLACFAQSNTLSKADKIYGLSKFWQEVNYNFVYLDQVDRPLWDSTYKSLITTIPETPNDFEYYKELQKFCALLKDGHTNVYMPATKDFELMNTMFGDYRFFIENIEGKAIIVRVNSSKKEEIPLGSEIISVNGKQTNDFIAASVAPYISSSTDYVLQDLSRSKLLQGRNGDQFTIQVKKPKGEIVTLNLTHKPTVEKETYPAFETEAPLLDFKWFPNNVAYLALNSFSDSSINKLFLDKLPELYKAKSVIIDLRNNGGGSTSIGTKILQYFTTDTLLYGSRNYTRQNTSAFKAWGYYTKASDTAGDDWSKKSLLTFQDKYIYEFDYNPLKVRLNAQRITVPVVVLIGHHTASAAEDFLIYADNQKQIKKIGQNTFGSTGQPYLFNLPGGGMARVCTKKDTYPDGRAFVGYGVKPDIEVVQTLKDYLKNNDAVLKAALQHLSKTR